MISVYLQKKIVYNIKQKRQGREQKMNVILKYKEVPEFKVWEAAVIGSFNGYNAANGRMIKQGDEWRFECSLPVGVYHYKFLINQRLLLNDPWNNFFEPEEEELWSVLYINQQGLQLCNPGRYQCALERCELIGTARLTEGCRKDYFEIDKIDQITAMLHFNKLYGLHMVTAAWYLPDGSLFTFDEKMVCASLFRTNMYYCFSLDSEEIKTEDYEGRWRFVVFYDGAFHLEKEFMIGKDSSHPCFRRCKRLKFRQREELG